MKEQELQEIREKSDIVEVISNYLPLTKKGKNYLCVCPFHSDTNPSMNISPDKQIFKCFSCNAGGNVFGFVQRYENISFMEAVHKVAEMSGIEVSAPLVNQEVYVDPKLKELYQIQNDAFEFLNYQLYTAKGKSVLQYLHSRGITDELIEHFELGYNPGQNELYDLLRAKNYEDDKLVETGLIQVGYQGMRDVFYQRITIPIHDSFGNPVGITARRIEPSDAAKYINTSETTLYTKGDTVFNYHRVKMNFRREKRVYLVEGAMDVIALAKVGVFHSIALLGTAVTKNQINLVRRLQVPLYLCYDGDDAGKAATYKFGKLAHASHLLFEVVDNRSGLDPDEIIDQFGTQELENMLERTISWVQFLFEYLPTKYNLDNYSQRKEFAEEIASYVEKLEDEFERVVYYERLQAMSGFAMQNYKSPEVTVRQTLPTQKKYVDTNYNSVAYTILSQMMLGVSACNYFEDELGYFEQDSYNALAMYLVGYYRKYKEFMIADFLNMIEEEDLRELALNVYDWELKSDVINYDVLFDAMNKSKAEVIERKIVELEYEIGKLSNPIEKAKLANERNELVRSKNELRIKERGNSDGKSY